ncbi:oxaloacetate decarboxylase [Thermosipho melanesiensis]|uniref:Conserved carboxylase region n=2 Tax=Thermosipho melanesiensis TaxID=46541 RepID=A6LP47_THEM4|nr:pyruvate carboxylase subunit B [Thermosipho melanesiensis]ABR31698.1 Conserved carboxylase region [Thermosipho melanesiensis BI429]APT74721.1 oxaloacetate decarboxylase [Thermosipho melanesiensis]OOC35222.1 oxaloacetate decarboxylase [Thermosipho melanesiensis]OOC35432.1 oxaloacetate decarboxylase [Thermosipho melanesiensis]OOC36683.1 oxaloacetate decarboxylase [Thermosipho melanesiensis]
MFVDTTLRDGHQSLIATRMRLIDMLPALDAMDSLGFNAMEVWGGATFDVCVRFLKENPWERIKVIKSKLKNTKTQMLLRGQNLVGYRHYADDVVELFVKKAIENGVDNIRVFDALNDIRNLEKSIEVALKNGAHVQGAISYTVSPVHTVDYYLSFAQQLVERGVNSLCIKDMAGLLTPKRSYELVKKLKERFNVPVELHTHCTSGLGDLNYIAAVEAGVDMLDTALSPFALGTSQPPYESMYFAIREYRALPEIDWKRIAYLVDHFTKVREKYKDYDVAMKSIDYRILVSQVPGGMYSNLVKQLSEQKMLNKLPLVLEEIPKVRKDLGYPPLVTPTSQIVGVQAVLNVLTGERYKKVTNEVKNYVKGMYGRPPAPIDGELMEAILGDEKPIECRPADLLEFELEKFKKEIGILADSDEDLLIYVILGEVGRKYLREKYEEKILVDLELVEEYGGGYPV